MNQKNIIIIAAIAILVVGVGSFYGGMKYAGSKNPQNSFQRNGMLGANDQRTQGARTGATNGNGARGNGFINGEIIKIDDKSITIKSNDGGSKTVYISDKTTVSKSVDGAKNDMQIGGNVMISGTANTDGSIVAQVVQLRPAMPNNPNSQQNNASSTK
jgi:hypothetical protein